MSFDNLRYGLLVVFATFALCNPSLAVADDDDDYSAVAAFFSGGGAGADATGSPAQWTGMYADVGAWSRIDQTPEWMTSLEVDDGLLETVQDALPESSAVGATFLNPRYDANLSLSQDAQISVTFIDEGAGYRNALGYFAYQDGAFDGLTFGDVDSNGSGNVSLSELDAVDGVDVDLIFPNASKSGGGGYLNAGDTVVLGEGTITLAEDGTYEMEGGNVFSAGSNLGFFVSANAWNGRNVSGWNGSHGDPATYYTQDFLNPENMATAVEGTITGANRHTAMMFASVEQNEVIMGFEDLNRLGASDEDFNDAVFIVRSNPVEALQQADIAVYPAPVSGLGTGIGSGLGGVACVIGALMGPSLLRRRKKED